MKLTDHKTEAVYRRYAIAAESDLREYEARGGARDGSGNASLGDNSVTARRERSLNA